MNEIVVSSDRHFGRAILGLNRAEVYAYLNEISSAYEELQLQIQVLKDQNNKLSDSNRDNALKLYNLQSDITEAQKKTDLANVELEAAKKECAALRKELAAAEKRIGKLTDDLIKTGADIPVEERPKTETVTAEEEKGFTPKPIFDFDEPKAAKKEEPKDIFAELRDIASSEKKRKEAAQAQTVASDADTSGDEVYAGEVEVKVDESMLIGNDDDEEEGFTFL
ncbi:MAG: DivIVA domain-containing protein [Bacteroides sp.]|nr:DivIVA domain-containing protein [Bacteroides sp.]MCM1548596.1 DivIVA domain-containing protein [Clostridium sp.]